jgi:hypothetical protein
MTPRDRLLSIGLLALAVMFWAVTGLLLLTRSPEGDIGIQMLGAVLLGVAFGVTAMPLLWLAVFARHRRIAYRGDWTRAGRRGAWIGLVVALLVALRTQQAFSLPIAIFVAVMVLFVEVSLSVER